MARLGNSTSTTTSSHKFQPPIHLSSVPTMPKLAGTIIRSGHFISMAELTTSALVKLPACFSLTVTATEFLTARICFLARLLDRLSIQMAAALIKSSHAQARALAESGKTTDSTSLRLLTLQKTFSMQG